MSIQIVGYRILLKPEKIVEKFESSVIDLVKPEVTKEDELRNVRKGEVLQVGAECYKEHENKGPWCKVGDTVLINPMSGFNHQEGEEMYLIVNEEDILAVIGD